MENDGQSKASELPVSSSLLHSKAEATNFQLGILVVSVFLKGGLLGAYVPFSFLWLSEKGYNSRELGIVGFVDAASSLLLPVIGASLDKLRSHNLGFVLLLVALTILKLCYLPAASSFIAILCLAALTSPLLRASNSILDALALYAFQEKGNFTKVRMFGDLGFGSIGMLVGLMYNLTGNIDVVFWIFAGICLTLAMTWFFVSKYMDSIRPDSKQMSMAEFCAQLQCLKNTSFNASVGRALFCVWLLGACLGVIGTFEFVLLKRLMGSGILLGLCKLTGTLCALPVWWFIPSIMDNIGIFNVQLIGIGFAALRLYILGVIVNPWHALISEACSGIGGFAIAYGTITIFAGRVVEEDMKGTVQTVIFVIFTGFGSGGSTLIAGYFAYEYGLQNMFLAASAVTAGIGGIILLCDVVAKFVLGSYQSLEESFKDLP